MKNKAQVMTAFCPSAWRLSDHPCSHVVFTPRPDAPESGNRIGITNMYWPKLCPDAQPDISLCAGKRSAITRESQRSSCCALRCCVEYTYKVIPEWLR